MTETTPDGVMRIQGFNPDPAFSRLSRNDLGKEVNTTGHLEDARLTIKKVPFNPGDAVISIGGKELLIKRMDNTCISIIDFLRSRP